MSTIKVDTIATRTGSGNITLSNNVASLTVTGNVGVGMTPNTNYGKEVNVLSGTSNVRLKLANSTTGSTNTDGFDLIADGNGAYVWNRENSLLAFATNNDEKLRLHSNGVFACSAGVALGVGVNNTASNVLDDYEEGTWTPNCATAGVSGSYSVQLGRYIKIGNLVQCIFNLTTSSSYTGSTSSVFQIGGLPFSNKYYDGSLYAGGHIGYYFNLNHTDNNNTIVYQIPSGSSLTMELKGVGDNIGEQIVTPAMMGTTAVIRGSITYHAA